MAQLMDAPLPVPDDALAADLVRTCAEEVYPAIAQRLASQACEPRHLRGRALQVLFEHLTGSFAASRGLSSSAFVGPIPVPAQSVVETDVGAVFAPLSRFDLSSFHVRVLGTIYERLLDLKPVAREPWLVLDKSRRKGSGSYYTPPFIINHIINAAIGPLLDRRIAALDSGEITSPAGVQRAIDYLLDFRVLDPAMGTGHFLSAAVDFIAERVEGMLAAILPSIKSSTIHAGGTSPSPLSVSSIQLKSLILQRCIFGVEIDPFAAAIARSALHIHVGSDTLPSPTLEYSMQAADSLRTLGVDQTQWGTYDAVIGNPPFVDSEALSRQDPELRAFARAHFESARGNWDLYVLFVELGLRLTRPAGFTAMVTPTRLLAADYSVGIQRLMLARSLVSCVDYSSVQAFGEALVPIIVSVVENAPPQPGHETQFVTLDSNRRPRLSVRVPAQVLRDLPDGFIGLPLRTSDPDLLAAATVFQRLATVADCFDGATTAEAYRIAEVVADATTDEPDAAEFLRLANTGLVDPFELHWGRNPCRYLGLTLKRPVVRRQDLAAISSRRLAQSDRQTVLIGGMGSRLEAVVAPPGYLCGKSAVLVVPHAGICPFALAAVLNTCYMSELYRALFGLRALSAVSLTIGPKQVARLPFPAADLLCSAPSDQSLLRTLPRQTSPGHLLADARRRGLLSGIGRVLSTCPPEESRLHAELGDRLVKAAMAELVADQRVAPSPSMPSNASK